MVSLIYNIVNAFLGEINMKPLKFFTNGIAIIPLAALAAANYTLFIFPNSFAPAGIDGICTMIQDILGVNMGYLSLLVNIPLIVIAYIYLDREFALKTAIYIFSFSISVILLKDSFITKYCYYTESGASVVFAPIAAGAIRGILYVITLRLNASSGGTDIISAIVKKNKPYFNFMSITFFINLVIALSTYFVYGMKYEPVICSIIYSFITSSVCNNIQAETNETVKFEIITQNAKELCLEISAKLGQTSTIMDAQGAYSGTAQKIVICVTDKHKAPLLESIAQTYPETVIFKSIVNNAAYKTNYK